MVSLEALKFAISYMKNTFGTCYNHSISMDVLELHKESWKENTNKKQKGCVYRLSSGFCHILCCIFKEIPVFYPDKSCIQCA